MILSADVAIIGGLFESSALFAAVDRRVGSGKLTFFMGERPFKKGIHVKDFFRPYNWCVWWRLHRRYDRKNVHFLAIGKGIQEDLRFLRVSKAHIWKWAYFPAVSKSPAVKTDSGKLKICWCGRMIPCKNVDVMIRAIGLLSDEDRKRCAVTIAGEGETKESCVSLASELGLMDTIDFRPVLPHDDVLYLMSESDVYVFPSDKEEGWGVALEEAMDRCCVPVACEEAGASVLIEDGVSGFLFKNNDSKFTEGFVTATLVVCVGAMAIVGSFQDGMAGDPSILYIKAIMDGIITIVCALIGSGGREEKIRTYNFPQNRFTDHRIGYTAYNLDLVITTGALDEVIAHMQHVEMEERMDELK